MAIEMVRSSLSGMRNLILPGVWASSERAKSEGIPIVDVFYRMPAAKALCVDRRRLNARGEKVRKEAKRPVRKVQ